MSPDLQILTRPNPVTKTTRVIYLLTKAGRLRCNGLSCKNGEKFAHQLDAILTVASSSAVLATDGLCTSCSRACAKLPPLFLETDLTANSNAQVLVRAGSEAGSISDESNVADGRKSQRRVTRSKPAAPETPILQAPYRQRRSMRQGPGTPPNGRAAPPLKVALLACMEGTLPEGEDECSHNDQLPSPLRAPPKQQDSGTVGATAPSTRSEAGRLALDASVAQHAASPLARSSRNADHSAWARAARRLRPELEPGTERPPKSSHARKRASAGLLPHTGEDTLYGGSEDAEFGPFLKRAKSAEAESPAAAQQLYSLRSRSAPRKAPPGFGENPDPNVAAAARAAAASTQGPIKKRLKAAVRAAEEAEAAATAAGPVANLFEEACSTRSEVFPEASLMRSPSALGTPSTAAISCNQGKPPIGRKPALTPPLGPDPGLTARARGASIHSYVLLIVVTQSWSRDIACSAGHGT